MPPGEVVDTSWGLHPKPLTNAQQTWLWPCISFIMILHELLNCTFSTFTDQKYFHTKIFPYLFHIKPFIFKTFSWSHSLSDFHEIFSIKCRNKYNFFLYNVQIILFLLSLKNWFKNKVKFFHQILLYNHIKLWRQEFTFVFKA